MSMQKIDISKIKDILKDRKNAAVAAMGGIGILLVLLSNISFEKPQSTTLPGDDYASGIAGEITEILQSMHGVGHAQVLITLEKSSENQYVYEEKSTEDRDTEKIKTSSQKEYVFIDTGSGKQALISATYEPVIKGVLIVCDGADDPIVYGEILNSVTTLLDISSAKVHITKRK